jgi:hypothetical protein
MRRRFVREGEIGEWYFENGISFPRREKGISFTFAVVYCRTYYRAVLSERENDDVFCLFFAETKIRSPRTLRDVITKRGCLEGLALII